ncbi:hypothetical protein NK718_11470 [Alsobacter sp. SYSU M60028]|uniref:DUF3035 domain-containing protein n=1 Tax=Alsobacter ponti TaxID=2962936 RepID=A0ABT1LCA5_9HYPH|nr:hypothetical protein [Alsobacter ponti]MCP8939137.1 hypothetical protein [Alsobacter ponti]
MRSPSLSPTIRPALRRVGVAAAALTLAACASTAPSAQESAKTPPAKSLAETLGFATTPPEPAGFVKKTRPENLEYMAVGVTPPPRAVKARTPDQVKKLEQELSATRASNNAKAK